MMLSARLSAAFVRLSARRHRHILMACATTLVVSVILLGLIGVSRWRAHLALRGDTHVVMVQATQQLIRALHSRRGTLTFLRDTLNRRTDLSLPQLQAMGASAVAHTRHLLGMGLVRAAGSLVWWHAPDGLSSSELAQLNRAIDQRTRLRGAWRVPSTFTVTTPRGRVLLVMLEPLRASTHRQSAIVGLFDVKPFVEDFVASSLPRRYPVQLLDGATLLYRSDDWQPATETQRPMLIESPVRLDAARWTLRMQPGSTTVVQTLSWLNVLVIGLSLVAGLGIIIIVWMLAARTWILQRAVNRRTAALRRTSDRLRQMATTDDLTGLHNRRFFLDRWTWECERAKRYQRPLACLMIDVNGFKQVNDRLGHQAGDFVLRQVAQELKTLMRHSDILARFGGDEFVIALPETNLAQAAAVAEKLRQLTISVPEGKGHGVPHVRLSVGVGRIEEEHANPQDVLHAADQSLYASKRRLHANI